MARPTVWIALAIAFIPSVRAPAQAPLRLSFADAVAQAAEEAPAVALADLRVDEARARVRQVRSYLFPSVSAGARWFNRTFNKNSLGFRFPTLPGQPPSPDLIGPFDNVDARLRLNQTLLDLSGRARVRATRVQVEGATAEGGIAVEAATQGSALAYLRAARAVAVVAARAADSALAAELVGLAQAQKDAGVSAAIDVTRARTQLAVTEGGLLVARNQHDRARIDLARALGLDPATPLEPTDTLAASLPDSDAPIEREPAVALAFARRPDLATEQARGDAARQASAAISAERLPRLDLAADVGANGPTLRDAIATRQIGVQVTVPILDGFRREGRHAEQRAVVREAEIRARDLRHQIAADVEAALLDLRSAEAQQAIAAERLALAAEELAQARERFSAGVAGNIEVINAQVSLLRARDADIDARFAAAAARVALARAAGVARTLH